MSIPRIPRYVARTFYHSPPTQPIISLSDALGYHRPRRLRHCLVSGYYLLHYCTTPVLYTLQYCYSIVHHYLLHLFSTTTPPVTTRPKSLTILYLSTRTTLHTARHRITSVTVDRNTFSFFLLSPSGRRERYPYVVH